MLLREYLKEKKIKQCAAAEALGIGQGLISCWVNGKKLPRPLAMRKISAWSNGAVTPNDFYKVCEPEESDGKDKGM